GDDRDNVRGGFGGRVAGEPAAPSRRARAVTRRMRTRHYLPPRGDFVMGRTLCGRVRTDSGRLRGLAAHYALGSLGRRPEDVWQSTARWPGNVCSLWTTTPTSVSSCSRHSRTRASRSFPPG